MCCVAFCEDLVLNFVSEFFHVTYLFLSFSLTFNKTIFLLCLLN